MANTRTLCVPLVSLLGGEKVVGKLRPPAKLEDRLRRGLPFRSLEHLMQTVQLTREQAMKLFALPARTFSRRKRGGLLTFEEADRIVQFAELFAFAAHVLGSERAAAGWLQATNPSLRDAAPIDRLDNALGRQAIRELLNRIAYGMLA